MNRFVEPALIVVTVGLMAMFDRWPASLSVGHFVLIVSSMFLLHTLIRDLVLLYAMKRKPNDKDVRREGQCFCIESVVGTAVLLFGLMLFGVGIGGQMTPDKIVWLSTMLVAMLINYLLRDFVFSWRPWRIYRDPNHLNIIPRLKAGS